MGSATEFHASFSFCDFSLSKEHLTCNLHLSFRAREDYHYCSFSHYIHTLAIKLDFVILIQVFLERISPHMKYLSNIKEHTQNSKCAY